ncbi:chemotaxis protein CheB [Methanolobus zinderi]|uniref:chemotaxis protein CheB n=1 Tax=Methanolobus zinderi TaxID=536044 RepID=UPI001FE96B72|nr:chemotaxis protein CheB [Methanolobus zinderi]
MAENGSSINTTNGNQEVSGRNKSSNSLPNNNNKLNGSFPVVGIGASAGGLDALEKFFSAVPTDTDIGMAFAVVQHLAPDHKSLLSEIIERYTSMEVSQVKDGMAVESNHVYIIPPNRDMIITNGILHLMEPAQPRGYRSPIDIFFRSLASDQKEMAIGIVLSGTGSDGEQGVRAIKGEGGLVMVQNPEPANTPVCPWVLLKQVLWTIL